ncbi:type VI secretion system protein TssA [Castellaniella sp. GW247-6E4]|uniref:type VI secretion system protein TssA n=1 Tax=Castellaniella sp. GW247-6E4 TaxID=3140380 RepID=UPI003315EA37
MLIDVTPLLEPVSDAAPGGADIRDTEDYEAIAAEIEKMTSPTSSGQVDWQKVETLGTRLFSTQGKDFMIAAWVAAAWTERYGIEGLGAGLQLQEGLVSRYWETAQPPLKRLRGRRNALSWWTERTTGWFEGKDIPPLREEAHHMMVAAAESLDARLAELDPESTPLGPFVQQIRRLEVIAPPVSEAPAAEGAASGTDTPATTPSSTPPAPRAAPAGAAASTSRAFGAAVPAADTLDSVDAVIGALAPALSYVGQITNALRTLDRFNPLAIEMGRFAARGALVVLPPAQQDATPLIPPPVAITDAFATIASSGNADGLIEFCESRIATFPYWLDLDRESARGYGMLGEPGAAMRQAVVQSALAFVKRLPGIERLTFSDGTPFADEATLQWLENCKAENRGGGAALDRYSRVRQQALEAFDAGRRDEAMQCYQGLIESTWSGRERFQARLALAELLVSMAGDADLVPLVSHLADECRRHQLADWEPGLALQAWQLILRVARQALASPALADDPHRRTACQDAAREALRELAAIDLVTASKSR